MYKKYSKILGILKWYAFKILLIMRITTVILIATMLQVSASTFAQKITIEKSNASLESVLKEMHLQTGYDFFFVRSQIRNAKPVDINIKEATLETALKAIFLDQPFTYTVEKKTVIIKKKTPSFLDRVAAVFSFIDVRGTVVDEEGRPLAGATVTLKGTKKSVITSPTGEFTLTNVNEKATLVITYLGYEPKEILASANLGNISMALTSGKLDEVAINAGYYTVTDKERTGNISRIAAQDISKQPVSNPLAALQGRVPGLEITQSSGVPGSGFKVQIRGQSSLKQGSAPLFVIDGVPFSAGNEPLNSVVSAAGSGGSSGISPFNLFNPADIESIEILKDADATSIYGSRGANGVILISTKKGQNGEAQINLNIYSGFSRVTRTMDMLNTQQYIEMRKEAFKNDGTTPTIVTAPDLLLWDNTRYTDFQKLLIGGNAKATDGQLSINGGDKYTQYNIGGGYHRETTVFPGDMADSRVSVHLNLNHQSINKKFRMGLLANYGASNSNLTGGDLTRYINTPPNLLLFDENGKINWQEAGVYYDGLITNPLAAISNTYEGKFRNLVSNINISYEIIEGLKIKTSLGYNTTSVDNQNLYPASSINPNTGNLPGATIGKGSKISWIIEPQLEYNRNYGKGKLSVLIGTTLQQISSDDIKVTAQNYNSDILLGSIGAAGNVNTSNSDSEYKYNALYGRFNYNIQEKYILNLTGRRDGSSRFGPGKQFANYGALGMAWIFSNESFLKRNLPFLSFGKLRASYGLTGNDQIGNYKYLNTWANSSKPYQGVPGLQPSSLFNTDFAWETNKKSEIALEAGILGNRLQLSTAYFKNKSGNQLIDYQLPIQTGFATILKNFDAVIENSGWEFLLTTKNISTERFTWNTAFNLSLPKNKLVKFPGLGTSSYSFSYSVGQPLSMQRVFKYTGVNSQTGIYTIEDINNDGFYDVNDKIILKNTDPKFYGGFQNSFTYNSFELDVFFEFRKQLGYNYLYSLSNFPPGTYGSNQPAIVMERWGNIGEISKIQRFGETLGSEAYISATEYMVSSDGVYNDASYIRLKNVAVSYRFSPSFIKKVGLKNLKVYAQGQNLLTPTNYHGADPENQNLFVLPPLRTITGGIQLTL